MNQHVLRMVPTAKDKKPTEASGTLQVPNMTLQLFVFFVFLVLFCFLFCIFFCLVWFVFRFFNHNLLISSLFVLLCNGSQNRQPSYSSVGSLNAGMGVLTDRKGSKVELNLKRAIDCF